MATGQNIDKIFRECWSHLQNLQKNRALRQRGEPYMNIGIDYSTYTRQRKKPIPKRSTAARSKSSRTEGSAIEISNLARCANDLLRK